VEVSPLWKNGDALEAGHKPPDGLRGERDLGHQHDRLLAGFDDAANALEIDFGLAAAGDSAQ